MDTSWERAVTRLYNLISKRPFTLLAAGVLLTVLAILYVRGHLEFWTERNVLLSQEDPSVKRYQAYRSEFPDDYLILVLDSKDMARSKSFASSLGKLLEQDRSTVQEVFYRIPPEDFRRQALLLLEPEEIKTLSEKISRHSDLLARLAASPDLVTLLKTINQRISGALVATAVSGLFADSDTEETPGDTGKPKVDPEDLRVLSALMDSLYTWLTDAPRFRSPWGVLLRSSGGFSEDGYLVDEENGWVFVLVYLHDVEGSFNREGLAIERIRERIDQVSREIPDVTVGITGTPALNSSEMASSLEDMTRAMGLALTLIALVFITGFGQITRPLIAVGVLGMAIVWTLGWLSLTVGHLTILSMAFGSILIGLGIDFGIHLTARYEKERSLGKPASEALEKTLRRVGRAILSGALTTAAAFFALGFSAFRGIREFGWIAGWGILFCLIAQILLLPAAFWLIDRRKPGDPALRDHPPARQPRLERLLGWPSRSPRLAGLAALGVTLLALIPWGTLRFDYNLLHLQAGDTEAVAWERRLVEAQGNSSIYAVEMVDTLEQARQRVAAYEALPLVSRVESLASFLPADTGERMARIATLRPLLEPIRPGGSLAAPPTGKRVHRWLSRIRFKLREEEGSGKGEAVSGSNAGEPAGLPSPDTVAGAARRTERLLSLLKTDEDRTKDLQDYQERLFGDFRAKIEILQAALDPKPVTLEGLPRLLKKRFHGTTGKWLIQIYPEENVWELAPQKRFVTRLRAVSPEITGPAVQNYEATRSLLQAYIQGGLYAVVGILIILFVDFRNAWLMLLALFPLLVAGLWTLLGMRLMGLVFNPANLVIIPLLVGIGVDNGIHVIRHFLGSPSSEEEIAASSMGRAITLSSLTTMAGFGSLMIARHQGIHSIGALLTLAMATCLLASLIALPALLRLLPGRLRHRLWLLGQPGSRGAKRTNDAGCAL